MSESDRLRRWLRSSVERAEQPDESKFADDEEPAIFEQLDAWADERRERRDPKWSPPGHDPQALERLVEDRRARGVLRPRPERPR